MNAVNENTGKNKFIIRIEDASESCIGDLKKITGHISGKSIIPIIDNLDLEANPRASKSSSVTDDIQESIIKTPQLFAFKSKGILLAFSEYDELERSRYRFYVNNPKLEGILDGGHNTLAIGLYTLKKAYTYCEKSFPKQIKIWSDYKAIWDQSKEILEKYLNDNTDIKDFNYKISIEVIVPRDINDEACVRSFINNLFEICEARNNNAQLKDSDKANHKGFYEDLKVFMENKDPALAKRISWKSNEGGTIKAQDIVALSLIPLNLITSLKDEDQKIIEPIAPQKLYSAKGSCLQHFERIMASPEVTFINEADSKSKLINKEIESALEITAEIPELYDYIFEKFPSLYNKAGGSYGKISAVRNLNPDYKDDKKKKIKKYTPFTKKEIDTLSPDGFIMPIVYGLQALMNKENVNGQTVIKWSQPPMPFLEKNLGKIIENYSQLFNVCNFDPQKVGKASLAYQIVITAYQSALNGLV